MRVRATLATTTMKTIDRVYDQIKWNAAHLLSLRLAQRTGNHAEAHRSQDVMLVSVAVIMILPHELVVYAASIICTQTPIIIIIIIIPPTIKTLIKFMAGRNDVVFSCDRCQYIQYYSAEGEQTRQGNRYPFIHLSSHTHAMRRRCGGMELIEKWIARQKIYSES